MKIKINKNKIILAVGLGLGAFTIFSCSKDFLNKPPVGAINAEDLANRTGVEGMLIAAYSMLDGFGSNNLGDADHSSAWNPWMGSVAAGEAFKGGGYPNQFERRQVEAKSYTPDNSIVHNRWRFYYGAVQRANEVLHLLALAPEGTFTDAEITQLTAEVRFLRGVYHLDLAKNYYNVPYVDETISVSAGNTSVPNTWEDNVEPEVWSKIVADFQFAIDNLPATNPQVGRATSWAAKAFLAKTHMQIAKPDLALPILTDIIQNGMNVKGQKFDLQPEYLTLWLPEHKNGVESVFSVQMSVNEGNGANGANGNEGMHFNLPPWLDGPAGWGQQPSFDLVNSYRTSGGLPLLDTYNSVNVKHNFGLEVTDPFTPETGELDPRLDWTVARRGVPFHDWGIMNEQPRETAGPYWGKKWAPFQSSANWELVEGWKGYTAINYPMIRFADVLLLAAEAEVEVGSLTNAENYVNRVRARAANPAGFLKTYVDNSDPAGGSTNTAAANYVINQYAPGSFTTKEFARKAVRFERKLELATEGHRFTDLQRFDRFEKKFVSPTSTYMADFLNPYMQSQPLIFEDALGGGKTYEVLKNQTFTPGKHEVYPIPQQQIDRSAVNGQPVLKQNPGHL